MTETLPLDERPYKIPDNWHWVHLKNICKYIRAGTDKPLDFCEHKTEAKFIPVIANGIQNEGVVGYTSVPKEKAGTITISARGSIGHAIVRNIDYYPIIRLIVLSVTDNVLACYLKYIFDFFKEDGVGSTIPQLTVPKLKNKLIPLPPLDEQQRIVERIESLFSKLDKARTLAQNVIDNYELRRSAILHRALKGELTNSNINDWQECSLQSVCSMAITDGTHKTPIYCEADEGIPFISSKDVKYGCIDWNHIKYIVPELHEELYKRLSPQLDDILLAKNGTTGVAAIVDVDKVFDIYVTLAVLRPNQNIIYPRYLLYIINSPICKQQFDSKLTGIAVPNLHLRDIKSVSINLPSMVEQKEIVRILDSLLAKEQRTKELAELTLRQIDLMKKAILMKAFNG